LDLGKLKYGFKESFSRSKKKHEPFSHALESMNSLCGANFGALKFGSLDALTRDDMNIELQKIWETRKKTVLFITHSIPEAVFLSDPVVVLSPRPNKVVLTVDVNFKRPREPSDKYEKEFGRLCTLLRSAIRK
jgi:hypothetical protein